MSPSKLQLRQARKRRIRSRIQGTAERPRMTIHRSLMKMSVQLIDDSVGKTLISAQTTEIKGAGKNIDAAKKLGELIAKKAKDAKITTVVFDRNAYRYHGRVQALADAAREAGLTF